MAATVMSDTTITAGRQKKHLGFPTVRTKRPPMAENNGLARTPILVINLRAVFSGDCVHTMASLVIGVVILAGFLSCILEHIDTRTKCISGFQNFLKAYFLIIVVTVFFH